MSTSIRIVIRYNSIQTPTIRTIYFSDSSDASDSSIVFQSSTEVFDFNGHQDSQVQRIHQTEIHRAFINTYNQLSQSISRVTNFNLSTISCTTLITPKTDPFRIETITNTINLTHDGKLLFSIHKRFLLDYSEQIFVFSLSKFNLSVYSLEKI